MKNELQLSQRNFFNHPAVIEAVQRLNVTAEQGVLLDRVTRNWLMEDGWLNLEQFRVKWRESRSDFGLLQTRQFVTETEEGRYRPKFISLCVLFAGRARTVSRLVQASNALFKYLRKFYKSNIGNARIDLDRLATNISMPPDLVTQALTLLGDTSLSVYLNYQQGQVPIVSVNENILHYETLWGYMLNHIQMSTGSMYSSVFDIYGANKVDYYGDILAVVPDGADLYTKCMERMQSEPDAAITLSRTLVESTLKWLAHDAGNDLEKNLSMPKLFDVCMDAIGHAKGTADEEIGAVELVSGIDQMLTGLAKLRNKRGNAHGRKPGQPSATRRHARLAVLASVALSLYLVEAREAVK
jgi:hypothetical protein